jgi:radical SAM-linked protein
MQRLRVKFSRNDDIKFLSHLDLMRLWERAFRRAKLPLTYSEGFSPHPKISLAAPLAVGVTSQGELMDVWLDKWISPDSFVKQVKAQLPANIDMFDVSVVVPEEPSLQSRVRFAEYMVAIETDKNQAEVEAMIRSLLDRERIEWHHTRHNQERYYNLRALIDDIWFISLQDSLCLLGMRLKCDSAGTGRPEQVTGAMGFVAYPCNIHRTRLVLEQA